MYTHQEERSVENISYNQQHIERVLKVIRGKFGGYFKEFIETEDGYTISKETAEKIATSFELDGVPNGSNIDLACKYKRIIHEAILAFEKDRDKYIAILDQESLEEYEDDPQYFKSNVLKNECPIIHATLHNRRVKELDKYRYKFSKADAGELLDVVENLTNFAQEYYQAYDNDTYDDISSYVEMDLNDLDTEEYTVFGVIGGGIKSHMLYKVYPSIFSNRSRDAIWALWYLSDKKEIDCRQGSEFLMIDVDQSITQQNYFYPYELFSFYAHQIF